MRITRNEDKSSPGMVFLSGTLYDFICLTLSVTAFCKIGTFYGNMASLAAINYLFGSLASLQQGIFFPSIHLL